MRHEIERAENGVIWRDIWGPQEWDDTDNEKIDTTVFEMPTFVDGWHEFDEEEIGKIRGFLWTVLDKLGLDWNKYRKNNISITTDHGDHYEFQEYDRDFILEKIKEHQFELECWEEQLGYLDEAKKEKEEKQTKND